MPAPLFLEERRRFILERLKQEKRLSVNALSEELDVSAVTIRQDLRALEQEGLLERTYGGALLPDRATLHSELAFDIRWDKHREEKDAIGRAAAALVQTGYAIALDSSTTACAMLAYLKAFDHLTIVTNSLVVAQHCLDCANIEVLFPAGRLRADAVSIVGKPETIPDINLNVGFFSAYGLSLDEGVTEIHPDEVAMKQALMNRCLKNVIIVDSSKWGRVAPYTFMSAQDVSQIITTIHAPRQLVTTLRHAGVLVDLVAVAG